MKRYTAMIAICVFVSSFAAAQEQATQKAKVELLNEFTRSSEFGGILLNFVLLNNRTVDVLFEPPGKYAIRARANQATMFYVYGSTMNNLKVDNKFTVEQDGLKINAAPHNIKNFEGNIVAKGERINGLLQIERRLDLSQPFKIQGTNVSVNFELSEKALQMMNN